jgi:hypothetical protein
VGEIAGHPVRFPVVRFPDERTGRLYHDAGVPATLLVDGGGRVLRVHMGRHPEPGPALHSLLRHWVARQDTPHSGRQP